MANTQVDSKTRKQQQPWWAIPATLGIIMVTSGIFVVLLAHGISIFSTIPY
jgi:hypothetical protein